jgi:hypothetical protein
MDIILPSMIDPGMAPAGKHVMSVFVQYAPSTITGGWDNLKRDAFGNAVLDAIARFAPNIRDIIIEKQVLTPADIERITDSPRNIFRASWRYQLFFLHPSPGWAYRTPVRGPAMRFGNAPGARIMGAGGRWRRWRSSGVVVNRYDATGSMPAPAASTTALWRKRAAGGRPRARCRRRHERHRGVSSRVSGQRLPGRRRLGA